MKTRSTTLSPGVVSQLAAMGIKPDDIGRVSNNGAAGGTGALPKDVPIPTNATELAEFMGDPGKYAPVVKSRDALMAFIQAYADKTQPRVDDDRSTALSREVDEAVQKGIADFLRENGAGGIPKPMLAKAGLLDPYAAADKTAKAKGLWNKRAVGAEVDDVCEDAGDFFRTIWRSNGDRHTPELQDKLKRLKNFSSDIPSDGGFLIPETLRSELLRVALESAVVRPRARVVPMETLRVPFPAIDSTSNVSSVMGGLVGYWTEEGAQLTSSKAKFGRITLDAKKLTIYTQIPSELLSDSLISLTAFVDQAFPEALAFFEDLAFLTGSGVGEPLGILEGAAAISVSRTASGNAIEFPDIVNMFARMLPQSMPRAVWVASINTFPSLAQMAMTRGTDGIASPPVWLTGGQAIGAPPMTIFGRPVVFTEKVPASGAVGDISLVDFGYYLLGDRQAMQAKQSEDFKFDTDEVAFRVIERVDGRPWLQNAITPANGGDTLSPIVKLGA